MSGTIFTGWATLAGGVLTADLRDSLGFVTHITGTPVTRDGVRGWELSAVVVVPQGLSIPWLDDEPPERAA